MANRFTQLQQAQYIDPYVGPDMDFIKEFTTTKKKEMMDSQAALAEATGFMGAQAGRYTKGVYDEYTKDYQQKLDSLYEQLIQNPMAAAWVAPQIKSLQEKMKTDKRRQLMDRDLELTKAQDKELAVKGISAKFDISKTLKKDAETGEWGELNPELYRYYTDKDLGSKMFDEVGKLKSDLTSALKRRLPYSYIDENGNTVTITEKTKTTIEELTNQRIKAYLESSFRESERNETLMANYINELEQVNATPEEYEFYLRSQDPRAVNWRKSIFNDIANKSLQQAYKREQIEEDIQVSTKQAKNSTTGNDKNPGTSQNDPMVAAEESVGNLGFNDPEGNPIKEPDQIDKSVKKYSQSATKSRNIIFNPTDGILVKDGYNQESTVFNELLNNQNLIVYDHNTKEIRKDLWIGFSEETQQYLEAKHVNADFEFFNILSSSGTNQRSAANLEKFESDLKKASNVESYKPEIIKNARYKSIDNVLEGMFNVWTQGPIFGMGTTNTDSRPFENEKDPDKKIQILEDMYYNRENSEYYQKEKEVTRIALNVNSFDDLVTQTYEAYIANVKEELKGKPEGKIYEVFENWKNRISNVTVNYIAPSKPEDKAKYETALGVLESRLQQGSLTLLDPLTNKKIPTATNNISLYNKEGKLKNGVTLGFFVDPQQGNRILLNLDGERYEIAVEESGMQSIFNQYYADNKEYIDASNQLNQSLQSSYGQDGKFNVGGFTMDGIKQNVDNSGQTYYSYTDPITGEYKTTTNSNNIIKAANDFVSSIQAVNTRINILESQIQAHLKSGKSDEIEGPTKEQNLTTLAKLKGIREQLLSQGKVNPQPGQGNRLRM